MTLNALALQPALIQRPIGDILAEARTGGRCAILQRHVLEQVWENACFAWIESTIPESLDLPDDDFRDLVDKVRPAFMDGLEDFLTLAKRLGAD